MVDTQLVRAPVRTMFDIARDVERWPEYLSHYRFVTMRERASDGGGVVEMSANRPFSLFNWPTWWLSEMSIDHDTPAVRFRHIGGITTRMEVEWAFDTVAEGTWVRLTHVWDGPQWPLIRSLAATRIIGPVFVHGIATRTLAGLAVVAEQMHRSAS